MNRVTLAILAILAALSAINKAAAQGIQCAPHDKVVAHLSANYGETRHGRGVATGGNVMEVYASETTGTWTITVTTSDGVTCMVASGEGYDATVEAPGDPV